MFPLISLLNSVSRNLVPTPCPSCGADDRYLLVRRDRYFLPIDVSLCRSCGLVHTANTLSPEGVREFYAETYPRLMGMDKARSKAEGIRQAAIRGERIFARMSIESIVDIGCGDGYFLRECISRDVPRVLGIEPGVARRENAVAAGCPPELIIDRMVEDLSDLPFRPQVVTMFHVLEHLNRPDLVLRRVAELTDGWVIIEVPDILGDWESLGLRFFHVSHRSYFSTTTLTDLLRRCGLEPVLIEREGIEGGIYAGNLRIHARPRALMLDEPWNAGVEPLGRTTQREQVRAYLKPGSFAKGYPRSAMRLARLALFG